MSDEEVSSHWADDSRLAFIQQFSRESHLLMVEPDRERLIRHYVLSPDARASTKRQYRYRTDAKEYVLEGEALYHETSEGGVRKRVQQLTSAQQVWEVITAEHCRSGHGGRDSVKERLGKRWRGWNRKDIQFIINRCQTCAGKGNGSLAHGSVDRVLYRLQVDLLNYQTRPSGPFGWVLHLRDSCSGFTMLFAIREKTAECVAEQLGLYVRFVGAPAVVQSSQDNAAVVKGALTLLERERPTGLRFISTRDIETQRLAQEYNGKVNGQISKWMTEYDRPDWHRALTQITYYFNSVDSVGSKPPPNKLVFRHGVPKPYELDEGLPVLANCPVTLTHKDPETASPRTIADDLLDSSNDARSLAHSSVGSLVDAPRECPPAIHTHSASSGGDKALSGFSGPLNYESDTGTSPRQASPSIVDTDEPETALEKLEDFCQLVTVRLSQGTAPHPFHGELGQMFRAYKNAPSRVELPSGHISASKPPEELKDLGPQLQYAYHKQYFGRGAIRLCALGSAKLVYDFVQTLAVHRRGAGVADEFVRWLEDEQVPMQVLFELLGYRAPIKKPVAPMPMVSKDRKELESISNSSRKLQRGNLGLRQGSPTTTGKRGRGKSCSESDLSKRHQRSSVQASAGARERRKASSLPGPGILGQHRASDMDGEMDGTSESTAAGSLSHLARRFLLRLFGQ